MKFVKLMERDQEGYRPPEPIWLNPLHIITFESWSRNAPENGTRVYIVGQELPVWAAETAEEVARLLAEAS